MGKLDYDMNKFPMTEEGLSRLKAELDRLKQTERPSVIKALSEAREHGDLSENAEYHAARERHIVLREVGGPGQAKP